jgi:uncharacterized protein (TIGR00730 family)
VKRIAIFCGAYTGSNPKYAALAEQTARAIVARGYGVVFGGGRVGLMGAIADATLAAGGEAIGVIPRALEEREVAHLGLTELHVVETMHERKALMTSLCDAFIALPGGFGTLDELFEAITWRQLGYHDKPAGILNCDGYFDGLLAFLQRAVGDGFIRPADRARVMESDDPNELLDKLAAATQVP